VPSWGANTVRTECAVLTGLDETRLGFDRFNPYHRLIRQPLPTWVSRLREQGYYTVCLHPFDRRFYARDQVMPHLGFDAFLGDEDFADVERINGYVTDAATTRRMLQLLDEHGDRLLLFVITMENHGPWRGVPTHEAAQIPAVLPLEDGERAALGQYLRSVRNADLMIERLCAALRQRPNGGLLGFYGDHLPSFPGVFPRLGLHGVESDYFIWDAHAPGSGRQVPLQAHDFGPALLAAVDAG
jgi:phosphoglycerol transferase MdoB-like AlkP superfamily enzyme